MNNLKLLESELAAACDDAFADFNAARATYKIVNDETSEADYDAALADYRAAVAACWEAEVTAVKAFTKGGDE